MPELRVVTSPVDVLAVLRPHVDSHLSLSQCDGYSHQEAPKLAAAFDAVAELIEAAREAEDALLAFGLVKPVKARLNAALARCTGGES